MAKLDTSSCAVPTADGATHCSESARRWTLVAAIVGSGMAFVDGTIVNVALPAIQRAMNATTADEIGRASCRERV